MIRVHNPPASSGGTSATRETLVSSGGSSDINTAIDALTALGGGVVRLDGLIDMDGDVVLKDNVTLAGFGKGTGLRNNTANAYTIDFQGAALTYRATGAIAYGADTFTTSTAGDAADFTAGDYMLIKDTGSSPDLFFFRQCKVDGVGGTGVVKMYGSNSITCGGTPLVASLSGAIDGAGLQNMEIQNASSGSIEVDVDFATNIVIDACVFTESKITLNECGLISIHNNFHATQGDSVTHAAHIEFEDYVGNSKITDNQLENCLSAINWNGTSCLQGIAIQGNRFVSNGYGVGLDKASGTEGRLIGIKVIDNTFEGTELVPVGGGAGKGIAWNAYNVSCSINNNHFEAGAAQYSIDINPATAQISDGLSIVGNFFQHNAIRIAGLIGGIVSGNATAGDISWQFYNHTRLSTITGNEGAGVLLRQSGAISNYGNCITGNSFQGAISITGGATYTAYDNTISGNYCAGIAIYEDGSDNVITGNMINGNVTIGTGAGDVNNNTVISGNNIDGNILFNEAGQDYCNIKGNAIDGTTTTLTGTGNDQTGNTNY